MKEKGNGPQRGRRLGLLKEIRKEEKSKWLKEGLSMALG
jgi:hypothetical protein